MSSEDTSEPTIGYSDTSNRDNVTITPSDSVSQNGSSSSSAIRRAAAAKAAGLAVAAERLKEIQDIEMQELSLRHKKSAVELDIQLESANAELEAYDSPDSLAIVLPSTTQTSSSTVTSQAAVTSMTTSDPWRLTLPHPLHSTPRHPTSSTLPLHGSDIIVSSTHTVSSPRLLSTQSPLPTGANLIAGHARADVIPRHLVSQSVPLVGADGHIQVSVSSHPMMQTSPHVITSQHPVMQTSSPTINDTVIRHTTSSPDETLLEIVRDNQRQQQKLLDVLHLPKVELIEFHGDPLKYWLFVRQFDNHVDTYNVNNRHKLLLLLQHCHCSAKQAIECCAAMDPEIGYTRARDILEQRFGNEFVITEEWLKKVADGPPINPRDTKGLQNLSDNLRNCVENLSAMGQLQEVSTQRVLVRIVEKLPQFLRARWLREVQRYRRQHLNPDIRDLMGFVEESAQESNDPVYGHVTQPKPTSTGSRPTSFSITAASNDRQRTDTTSTTMFVNDNRHQNYNNNNNNCHLCEFGSHSLFQCDQFKALRTEDRIKYVQATKRCFNCLMPGHSADTCQLQRTCSVCGMKHTKFLHPVKKDNSNDIQQYPIDTNSSDNENDNIDITDNVDVYNVATDNPDIRTVTSHFVKVIDNPLHRSVTSDNVTGATRNSATTPDIRHKISTQRQVINDKSSRHHIPSSSSRHHAVNALVDVPHVSSDKTLTSPIAMCQPTTVDNLDDVRHRLRHY